MPKEKKPLNIYHVSELWSDGNDEYIVLTAFVRAESVDKAMQILSENRPQNIPEGSRLDAEMLGWATGERMYDEGLITLEFTPENL